jgi:acetoin utilization deacetylase AcuC-like enzyme
MGPKQITKLVRDNTAFGGSSLTQVLGIVYNDVFQQYNFGPTHPLKPTRLKLTFELMKETGLLKSSDVKVTSPRPI